MSYRREDLEHAVANTPAYPQNFSGRGIVVVAGGSYLVPAYLLVRSVRHLGCLLPIELWHIGEVEFPAPLKELFRPHGVHFVDFERAGIMPPRGEFAGWQSKCIAIVHSAFEEVLNLDADNFCVTDPSGLFDHPIYSEAGQLFWPDHLFEEPGPWTIKARAWEFLGLPARIGAELESGQILLNKRRVWRPLMLALHMNLHAEFYYRECTYGDKDTYRLAWEYLGLNPQVVPHRPHYMGKLLRYQMSPEGEKLFMHGRKWLLPVHLNPRVGWFPAEAECFEWLEELSTVLRVGE